MVKDNIDGNNNAKDTSSVSTVGGEAKAETQLEAEETTAQTNETENVEAEVEETKADTETAVIKNNDDVNNDNQKPKKISQSTVSKVVAKQRREYKREINDYQEQLNALKEKQAELEKVLNSANYENSKLKIINEYKLDNELSSLITADNEEAMKEQAQVISSRLTSNKGVVSQEGTNTSIPKPKKSWLDSIVNS